jgi:tripartite-type tricarboxylate transporter receptor subunit TctC
MSKLAGLILSALALAATGAHAADWPTKPVKLLIPYSAGGLTDLAGRVIAGALEKRIGQPVVVENRAGGDTQIAAGAAIQADPDGHTLLMAPGATFVLPIFKKDVSIDAGKLMPVTMLTEGRIVLATNKAVPAKTLKDLVAYAKANPGKLNYGSTGPGEPVIYSEVIKQQFGLAIEHVPYKGSAGYNQALTAGEIQIAWPAPVRFKGDTNLVPICVTGPRRDPALPDTPTCAQEGLEGIDNYWFGLFAPPATPADVVGKVSAATQAVLKQDDVVAALTRLNVDIVGSTPEALSTRIRTMFATWQAVAGKAGIKPE